MEIRKTLVVREVVHGEAAQAAAPITRAAGLVCIRNPFAGAGYVADLSVLFDAGREIGEMMMPELVELLGGAPVAYGKAALVGVAGDFEHGAACIHPKLGKPMRAAVGGGKALIPSNCKVAAAGTPMDLPLGHKDDPWSFAHFDTMTIAMADAPRPDEIVVIVAAADGGRVNPRVGDKPITD